MDEMSKNRGMIGKDNDRVQGKVTKKERELIQHIASAQDRSESYIVGKIVSEWLKANVNKSAR
jgi:hypothetical protein